MAKPSPNPRIASKKHIARLERERQQVNLIRSVAIGGIVIVLLLLVYGYLDVNVLQQQKPVAEVNGDVIKLGSWQERVRFQRANLLNQLNLYQYYQQVFGMDMSQQINQISVFLQTPETLGQQVLDQMIDEAFIRQEAERRGITVTDAEVQEEIETAYAFFPSGTPTPTITPTEFLTPTLSAQQLEIYPSTATPTEAPTETLEPTSTPDRSVTKTPTATVAPATPTFVPDLPTATATPYTEEGFNQEYTNSLNEFKAYNVSEETFRDVYRNQIYRRKLLEELGADVPHTEEQVWARHILVDSEEKANILYEQLTNGGDFAELARENSLDTGSGAQGGILDWSPYSAFVTEFADAAFSQPIGEIGKPVKSQFGYHIIQVIDRQERPLSADAYQQALETALTDWLDKSKADATEAGTLVTYDIWQANIPTEPTELVQATPSS